MEQIITKADIYKWITKIKETLTRHLQLVFNELTNEDVFCKYDMLIMNGRGQIAGDAVISTRAQA